MIGAKTTQVQTCHVSDEDWVGGGAKVTGHHFGGEALRKERGDGWGEGESPRERFEGFATKRKAKHPHSP